MKRMRRLLRRFSGGSHMRRTVSSTAVVPFVLAALVVFVDVIEVNEVEPNNTPAQAMRVLADKVPSITINGQINGATDVDYFVFSARTGQRILMDCQAERIDCGSTVGSCCGHRPASC